jgi:endoglucanase
MKTKLVAGFFALFSFQGFSQTSPNIRLNQVGFYTKGPKSAVVVTDTATKFSVKSVSGDATFYSGTLSARSTWAQSGENVKIADFTSFALPGNYVLQVQGLGNSYSFAIQDKALAPLNKALMKAYYFNRSSTSLLATYAGKWNRSEGHPDTHIVVYPTAASLARPVGTVLSAPKGWYDAGDYNSYIVNSGISTYTLLISYEHFRGYYDTLNLNIPESGNVMPDILDEIKWNLDWMLAMQDPNDGGVYFKKTTANFSDLKTIMPVQDTATRYMMAKSTSSAFDFAATMAVAYRIYGAFDASYANTCLKAAQKAYAWGRANPNIPFTNPPAQGGYPAVKTGSYSDNTLTDELEWASNELYIATKADSLYAKGFKNTNKYDLPDWGTVNTLGLLSLIYHRKELTAIGLKDTTNMRSKLLSIVDKYVNYQKSTSPYKIMMGLNGNADFSWGSNSFAANQAMLALNAFFLTRNMDYANAVVNQVDYLVGRNATGYCFVTGIGSKPVMHIHHRQSAADGIQDPVPGWMAGGPTATTGDGCPANATYPAKSYKDSVDCFTKNEIAINWNAPAVYITGALEYLNLFNASNGWPTALDESSYYPTAPSFVLFPVPSKEEVFVKVQLDASMNGTMKLTDALGREVVRKEVLLGFGWNQLQLDLHGVPAGVYVLNLETEAKNFKGKIVVEGN